MNKSEYLKKISAKIAYRQRYYMGEKYGFDAKKDLPKVNIDIDNSILLLYLYLSFYFSWICF